MRQLLALHEQAARATARHPAFWLQALAVG